MSKVERVTSTADVMAASSYVKFLEESFNEDIEKMKTRLDSLVNPEADDGEGGIKKPVDPKGPESDGGVAMTEELKEDDEAMTQSEKPDSNPVNDNDQMKMLASLKQVDMAYQILKVHDKVVAGARIDPPKKQKPRADDLT